MARLLRGRADDPLRRFLGEATGMLCKGEVETSTLHMHSAGRMELAELGDRFKAWAAQNSVSVLHAFEPRPLAEQLDGREKELLAQSYCRDAFGQLGMSVVVARRPILPDELASLDREFDAKMAEYQREAANDRLEIVQNLAYVKDEVAANAGLIQDCLHALGDCTEPPSGWSKGWSIRYSQKKLEGGFRRGELVRSLEQRKVKDAEGKTVQLQSGDIGIVRGVRVDVDEKEGGIGVDFGFVHRVGINLTAVELVCEFCYKPAARGEKLRVCTACNAGHFCSDECHTHAMESVNGVPPTVNSAKVTAKLRPHRESCADWKASAGVDYGDPAPISGKDLKTAYHSKHLNTGSAQLRYVTDEAYNAGWSAASSAVASPKAVQGALWLAMEHIPILSNAFVYRIHTENFSVYKHKEKELKPRQMMYENRLDRFDEKEKGLEIGDENGKLIGRLPGATVA